MHGHGVSLDGLWSNNHEEREEHEDFGPRMDANEEDLTTENAEYTEED